MKLPMTRENISPEWLTYAFRSGGRDVTVQSVELGLAVGGNASKIQLRIQYDPRSEIGDAPPTIILKTCMEEGRENLLDAGFYHRESFFFEQLRDRYDVRTIKHYYADDQKDPKQAAVLLEDLSGGRVRFGTARVPYTPAEVASALEAFAQMHARSMIDPYLTELKLPSILVEAWPVLESNINNIDAFLSESRGYAFPTILRKPERIAKALDAYLEMVRSGPPCLLHGDAHIGNTYVSADGTVSLMDWQLASVGLWVHDIAYFMGVALDMPDRRNYERDLLKHYLDKARSIGAPMPSFDEAWDLYKRAIFYGFFTWLTTGLDHQPMDICTAGCSRFGVAMVDHEVFDCLGV